MENKKAHKRNTTLDNFVIFSKKPQDENVNLNFTSNPSSSSSSLSTTNAFICSSSSSSSITTNTLTCSSSSDNSSTCFIGTDATNLTLSIEYSSPKSSSKTYPTDISQISQDPPSQPHLIIYPVDKENRSFQEKWYNNRPWMEYLIKLDSVFCYFCCHFSQGSTPTGIQRDAFTRSGFNPFATFFFLTLKPYRPIYGTPVAKGLITGSVLWHVIEVLTSTLPVKYILYHQQIFFNINHVKKPIHLLLVFLKNQELNKYLLIAIN